MEYPSFDMDVKFKDGSRGTQDFYFSDKDNLIEFSNGLNIEKDENGKWNLHFTREYKEMQTIAKAIALPNEINLNADTVKIPLSRVSIADNGNIEFELETTKDRRTGNTRNFTITPNSIKTSSTEIPFEQKGQTVGVKLPRNFAQLFLSNQPDSTIKNALPVEFFNVLTDRRYKEFFNFDDTNTHTLSNANIPHSESIDILNIDGNCYTLVNSKMMKIEAVSHVPQETSGYHDLTFVFKKGSEHVARTFKRVNTTKSENLAQFMGISIEDWNTKNRHLGEDPALTTAILTAKEFKTTDRSRVKNLTSDGIEPEEQLDQPEPESSFDITPNESATEPTQDEQNSENFQAETQSAESNGKNGVVVDEAGQERNEDNNLTPPEQSADATSEAAPENASSTLTTDKGQNEPAPEKKEQTKEEQDGKKEAKKEKYTFSLAPLFYGIGVLLGVLSILTGMIWLLALGTLFVATPKLTEGIVNDKKVRVKSEAKNKTKKAKRSKTKTKTKTKTKVNIKAKENLRKSIAKSKDKNLKLAHKLLRKSAKQVEITQEWNNATKGLFSDKKISENTKNALAQLKIPADASQLKNHSDKLKQFDEFLTSVQKEIANPEGRFNDKQKEELAPLVENALGNLKEAKNLNSELTQDYNFGASLKNEAQFSTLTQQKMVAGFQKLGLEPQDICDEAGNSTFGNETIENLNQRFDDTFQTYKGYLGRNGILENSIKEIYTTMDKFQAKTTNTTPSRQP